MNNVKRTQSREFPGINSKDIGKIQGIVLLAPTTA